VYTESLILQLKLNPPSFTAYLKLKG